MAPELHLRNDQAGIYSGVCCVTFDSEFRPSSDALQTLDAFALSTSRSEAEG